MSKERIFLIKEFLKDRGFEWGDPYDREERLDDCNLYYINLYDGNLKHDAHAVICESSTELEIQEREKDLHEYGDYMEYNFSREWTLYLLKNAPEERTSVLLDINRTVKNITEKMNEDLEGLEYQMDIIKKEANLKMDYYEKIVDEYRNDNTLQR